MGVGLAVVSMEVGLWCGDCGTVGGWSGVMGVSGGGIEGKPASGEVGENIYSNSGGES